MNKVTGGEGYAQKDDGSGAIVYNMGDGDMPTYTLYMGKEGNKRAFQHSPRLFCLKLCSAPVRNPAK